MTTKHTPGPWVIFPSTLKGMDFIIAAPGQSPAPFQWHIAYVTEYMFFKGCVFDSAANARLIAAAPEMLEVLKKVYALGHARPEAWINSLLTDLSGVIKKAEGKGE